MSGPTPNQDIFDVRRIRRLVELMKEHDLSEIDIREGATRIQAPPRLRSGGDRRRAACRGACCRPRRFAARRGRSAQRRRRPRRRDQEPDGRHLLCGPRSRVAPLRESGRPRRAGDHGLHRRGDEGLQPDSGRSVGQDHGRAGRERPAGRVRSTSVQSGYAGADVQTHSRCQSGRDRPADLSRLPRAGHRDAWPSSARPTAAPPTWSWPTRPIASVRPRPPTAT